MTAFIALVVVAAVSWVFRASFTAVWDQDRLPAVVRSRSDAVAPAAFAALLGTHLAAVPGADVVPAVVAVGAAAVVARVAGSHVLAVVAAVAVWWLFSW